MPEHESPQTNPGASQAFGGAEAKGTGVGPRAAALGFTRADIEEAKRKADRIERKRRQRDADREWEARRRQEDVLVGLRTVWRMAAPEDRPGLERIAQLAREGAL